MAESARFDFQAEVSKLLHMMVHSVYSDREVFLRELISNAADACDRRRYEALTDAALLGDDPLEIRITADPQAKTLTVADSGIGMSREELIENLGTIARSGTQRFMEQIAQAGNGAAPSLIGQFGVGFYAAFIVADRVEVVSRRAGSGEAWVWASGGQGAFTIEPATRDAVGTTITLHLKENASEFLDKFRLQHIIRTYSDHIAIPIKLGVAAEVPETVNSAQALWTRPKSEIEAKDYESFYQDVAGLYDKPLRTLHLRAEGTLEYTALLFTPGQVPADLYDPARKSRVKLYVRRVFITDDCNALLPAYLRFLRGVVDAQDLPLNVSREMLQREPVLAAMKKAITGRVLSDFAKLAKDDPETYAKFWNAFGAVLKEGLYEDYDRRQELLKLARFKSSAVDGLVSLDDYLSRMKEGQEAIYYLAGDAAAGTSPQLEGFKARGVEVLLLPDAIDDFWLGTVPGYEGKRFESVTRAGADLDKLGTAEVEGEPVEPGAMDRLIALLKTALGERVKDIRRSDRLTDSPVCLVAGEGDLDLRFARLLRAHEGGPESPRILELNPRHPLIRALAERAGKVGALDALGEVAELLLDQARLLEGERPTDAAAFARRLSTVMVRALA